MSVQCITCNVFLKTEKCLQSHRKSKRHIDKVNNTAQSPNFTCHCGKNYAHRQSLHVHRRTCLAEKPEAIIVTDSMRIEQLEHTLHEERNTLFEERKLREQFQKESDELRRQVSLLLDRNTTQINTTNNNKHNTNIGTQNIIINVNAFGSENTDYIDDKSIMACIGRVYKSIPTLLEKIHFDPKHP